MCTVQFLQLLIPSPYTSNIRQLLFLESSDAPPHQPDLSHSVRASASCTGEQVRNPPEYFYNSFYLQEYMAVSKRKTKQNANYEVKISASKKFIYLESVSTADGKCGIEFRKCIGIAEDVF